MRVFTAKLPCDVDGARKSTLVMSSDGFLDIKPEVRVVEGVRILTSAHPRVVVLIIVGLDLLRPSKAKVLEHALLSPSLLF